MITRNIFRHKNRFKHEAIVPGYPSFSNGIVRQVAARQDMIVEYLTGTSFRVNVASCQIARLWIPRCNEPVQLASPTPSIHIRIANNQDGQCKWVNAKENFTIRRLGASVRSEITSYSFFFARPCRNIDTQSRKNIVLEMDVAFDDVHHVGASRFGGHLFEVTTRQNSSQSGMSLFLKLLKALFSYAADVQPQSS